MKTITDIITVLSTYATEQLSATTGNMARLSTNKYCNVSKKTSHFWCTLALRCRFYFTLFLID